MNSQIRFVNIILVAVVLCATLSAALDEDSARERKCVKVPIYQGVNRKWMDSIRLWYYPLWSKLELYRTASDMLELPVRNIPESVLDTACVISDNFLMLDDGFNRTNIPYDVTPADDGTIDFKIRHSVYGKRGKLTIGYTDNKDFVIGITCWEDNELSYGIWTVGPKLSEKNKKMALTYVEGLGFNPANHVEISYDNCPETEKFKKNNGNLNVASSKYVYFLHAFVIFIGRTVY